MQTQLKMTQNQCSDSWEQGVHHCEEQICERRGAQLGFWNSEWRKWRVD